MENRNTEVLFGLYDKPSALLDAVKVANEKELEILDVYSPFPVHGLDSLLGLKESRLHIAGFIYGAIGALFGFGFMSWVFVRDWPMIFGGKPYWSVPAFIPVTFEMTVLFSAIGMVVTFYIASGLGPGVENPILDPRISDDKFCIAFDTNDMEQSEVDSLKDFFSSTGASEINTKTV